MLRGRGEPSFNINSPITPSSQAVPRIQEAGYFQDVLKQKKTTSFQPALKTITVWMVNGLWHRLNIIFHYFPAQSTQMTYCLRLKAHSFKALFKVCYEHQARTVQGQRIQEACSLCIIRLLWAFSELLCAVLLWSEHQEKKRQCFHLQSIHNCERMSI